MKGILLVIAIVLSFDLYAANEQPLLREARVEYDTASVPELTILGQNLCSTKRQDGLVVVLGDIPLSDVQCQMIGTLASPLDMITAPLLHNPAPGDYQTEVIVYSGNTGIVIRFYLTLGAAGPQGISGVQGFKGEQGIQGDQGLQGITGAKGIQGSTGAKGDQGIQGITGAKGDQGIQGFTGAQGDQGIQGFTGAQGDQGIQGFTGVQGNQGIEGITGAMGDQGIQGTIGAQGNQGIQGIIGLKGDQGIQGEAGQSGISALASRACPLDYYLAGFQESGELLCREMVSTGSSDPSAPPVEEPDTDFSTACFSFDNNDTENLLGNNWLDDCIKPDAVSLRILVKDSTGAVVYDESTSVSDSWTQDAITSTASLGSQHITSAHDQLLTMTNGDKMIITGKNSNSTAGCLSSFANGYGLVIYSPLGSNNVDIRMMVMGYKHGIRTSPEARSISGWTQSSEITFAESGDINSCDSAIVTDAALTGSMAIFVN